MPNRPLHNKQVYSRFCSTAEAVCPSSVSPPTGGGGSSLGGCYPPSRSPLRREQTHICEPAPPALLPISQRSRLAASITADAGGLLPFHPLPVPHMCGHRRDYSLLPSCVTAALPRRCPTLRFRWVAFPAKTAGAGSREVPLPCMRRTATDPLLVSEGDSPAGKWVARDSNPELPA